MAISMKQYNITFTVNLLESDNDTLFSIIKHLTEECGALKVSFEVT